MRTDGSDDFAVSTIVEDVFQYFDEDLIAKHRRYQKLERRLRLRSALVVFMETGLAEPDKSLSMWVPTKDLMDALGTSRLTTLVKPLNLPACVDLPRSEARKYYAYAVDLGRRLKDLPEYLALMRPALGVWELGWAEHGARS